MAMYNVSSCQFWRQRTTGDPGNYTGVSLMNLVGKLHTVDCIVVPVVGKSTMYMYQIHPCNQHINVCY